MRLHGAIFSLLSATPTFAISYWGYKTKGILNMLNLADYLADIEGLSSHLIIEKINEINLHYETERTRISNTIKKMNEEAKDTINLLNDYLKK